MLCYDFRSNHRFEYRSTIMTTARISPIDPPYDPAVQADFDKVMRGLPPLKLFRTVARNPRVLSRLMAGGLLDRGSISLRLRELVILRVTAQCSAEYEWGVHVAAYGAKAQWTPAELRSTVHGNGDDDCWSRSEGLAIRLCDALHEAGDVDDALWAELASVFAQDQLIELIMLVGNYHSISFFLRATRVELEKSAPRFPPHMDVQVPR
jgi:alkylhydroperoxidase family enzyme